MEVFIVSLPQVGLLTGKPIHQRAITHYSRFGEKAVKLWNRFRKPLAPIEDKIDYWLFQTPSIFKYNEKNIEKLRVFENKAKIGNKAVVEFRDLSWWDKKAVKEIKQAGLAFCSVNALMLPSKLVTVNETSYLSHTFWPF